MKIVLIAAVGRNLEIGRGNALLWHNRQDQQHFRAMTLGHPVVMGRRTWDSLPERFRPLPGRRNIVLTRDPHWRADGAERARSWDDVQALVAGATQVCVIGGAQVYALALPFADELVLTEVDASFADADAHFPAWESGGFEAVARDAHADADGPGFAFVTYRRWPTVR